MLDVLHPDDPLLTYVHRVGDYTAEGLPGHSLFSAISRIVIYQQLSGHVASAIHGRFCTLFTDQIPEPQAAADMSIETIRSAGLSAAKARSVLHLAELINQQQLPGAAALENMSDAEVIEQLTQVRGIGPWSAQIALMSWLQRPDVMPAADLGLRKGLQLIDGLDALPDVTTLAQRAEAWQPYRSVASWYLWRSLEL